MVYHPFIIPTKFLAAMGHLVATLLVAFNREHMIVAGLRPKYTTAEYNAADTEVQWFVAISCLCFVVHLSGLFLGITLFYSKRNNFIQGMLQAGGSIYLSWAIINSVHYAVVWRPVLFAQLPCTLLDLWMIFAVHVLKLKPY